MLMHIIYIQIHMSPRYVRNTSETLSRHTSETLYRHTPDTLYRHTPEIYIYIYIYISKVGKKNVSEVCLYNILHKPTSDIFQRHTIKR